MSLEISGKALNRLRKIDADTAARISELGKIVAMRNIIAHEYGYIDYEIVWGAAAIRTPALIPVPNELVDEAPDVAGL